MKVRLNSFYDFILLPSAITISWNCNSIYILLLPFSLLGQISKRKNQYLTRFTIPVTISCIVWIILHMYSGILFRSLVHLLLVWLWTPSFHFKPREWRTWFIGQKNLSYNMFNIHMKRFITLILCTLIHDYECL